MTAREQITVIGSGLMGHGIAQIFASQGHAVHVCDPDEASLQTVPERIRANLNTMAEHGISFLDGIDTILGRVSLTTDMQEACQDADFVIEAVYENMELKQQIFSELDAICSVDTILCSNTSVMSITEIASTSSNRQRIVGTHFWNPPYLIPLVEVVKGDDTELSSCR